MAQLGFFVDLERCTGCQGCTIACKTENNTPLGVDWRRVIVVENGSYPRPTRLFVTMACFHCEQPACKAACPVNAISKRETDGIVLIDQDKCIGCRRCVWACPYGAPRFNPLTEKVEKCTLCVHRVDSGMAPACVTTCVGEALQWGPIEELRRRANQEGRVEDPPSFTERGLTRPNVVFIR
jgi:anaerobic dimethyl sulfoxide reductase subunit B (iron-sulfur subunit)